MLRFLPTVATAFLCAVCISMAISSAKKLFRAPDATFIAPDNISFVPPETGEFTLWQFFQSTIDDEVRIEEPLIPSGTKIRISRGDGTAISTTADTSMTVTSPAGKRRSVLRFTISRPEEHRIEITGLPAKRKFEVTHGPLIEPMLTMMGWFGGGILLGIVSVVLGLLAGFGVFPKKPGRPTHAGTALQR